MSSNRQQGLAMNFFACYGAVFHEEENFLRDLNNLLKTMLKECAVVVNPDPVNPYVQPCCEIAENLLSVSRGANRQVVMNQWLEMSTFLKQKNDSYGSSILNPIRVFSTNISRREQILVRVDDKVSRIVRGNSSVESMHDTVKDILGYAVHLRMLESEK